jgi:sugar lactone lactonase YvrE
MRRISIKTLISGLLILTITSACNHSDNDNPDKVADTEDSKLQPVLQTSRVWNGVTINPTDGRTFVSFNQADGPGVQLAEVLTGNVIKPYPDSAWNTTDTTKPLSNRFVAVNAVRYGPDGLLWVVDAGAKSIGKPAVPGGGRLLSINTATNTITKIYDLRLALQPMSYVDDIRFNGPYIYITDAGAPGLIVINQTTGEIKRRLDNHYSTTNQRPMYADGKITYDEQMRQRYTHADQLEVSPNGRWLYYAPACGPLYRVGTDLLNNFSSTEDAVRSGVQLFFDGPTCGGTAISAAGNIYYADPRQRRILKVDSTGKSSVLLADKRLLWPDAMWIDNKGDVWIPATQQNLTPGFNSGKMEVKYPVWIYKYNLGSERPSPIDHK